MGRIIIFLKNNIIWFNLFSFLKISIQNLLNIQMAVCIAFWKNHRNMNWFFPKGRRYIINLVSLLFCNFHNACPQLFAAAFLAIQHPVYSCDRNACCFCNLLQCGC